MIEKVGPSVECGRYPACRIVGDVIKVTASIFGDGHDHLAARLMYKQKGERRWRTAPMKDIGNDLWEAEFTVDKLGMWSFTVMGWVDHFDTWVSDLQKRLDAQPDPEQPTQNTTPQDIPMALRIGALLLEGAAGRAKGGDARQLTEVVTSLRWMKIH